eukprot:s4725_g2.t1
MLNLLQNRLPPKTPGFQQGFQPTKHRTSCQSVLATLIIRTGSRKCQGRLSKRCGVPGGTQFWVPPAAQKKWLGPRSLRLLLLLWWCPAVVFLGFQWLIPRNPCKALARRKFVEDLLAALVESFSRSSWEFHADAPGHA